MAIEDADGNLFLDFAAGIAVNSTGHSHPRVIGAIKEQASELVHYSASDFYVPIYAETAREIARIAPMQGKLRTYLGNSGTEVVEASMKLARHYTGRPYIVGFLGGFHGRTYGSVTLTASKAKYHARFNPLLPGVYHAPFGKVADLKWFDDVLFNNLVPADEVAAVVIEPIQGEGGYLVPEDGFLEGLRELCTRHGILLVADEIQSGAGRTGKMWAVEHWNVEPDILLVAKGIASGMPLGAMVAPAKIMESWGIGAHGSTYGGNPVACAAALATIELLEGGLIANAAVRGEQAMAGLREVHGRHPSDGPRRAREGPHDRCRVRVAAARRGRPMGLLRAWPARPGVRQADGSAVPAAGRVGVGRRNGRADLRRSRRRCRGPSGEARRGGGGSRRDARRRGRRLRRGRARTHVPRRGARRNPDVQRSNADSAPGCRTVRARIGAGQSGRCVNALVVGDMPGSDRTMGSAAGERSGAPASLVGRGPELERIEAVLARREGLPAGVLLHGHAGIGKTVLWSEAVRGARQTGYRVLESALTRANSPFPSLALPIFSTRSSTRCCRGSRRRARWRWRPPLRSSAASRARRTSEPSRSAFTLPCRCSPRPRRSPWRSTTSSGWTPRRRSCSRTPSGGCAGSRCSSSSPAGMGWTTIEAPG